MQLQLLVDALREHVLVQDVILADETPVQMLAPGEKKIHRAYVWVYCSTRFRHSRLWFLTSVLAVQASMRATYLGSGTALGKGNVQLGYVL